MSTYKEAAFTFGENLYIDNTSEIKNSNFKY